jgi:(4S)-4-hydroxy-5-phosphonooxypentane-2,3-dione isomerase
MSLHLDKASRRKTLLKAVTMAALPLLLLHPAAAQQPSAAQQPVRSYLINVVNLDIAGPEFDKFMVSARENAEASLRDDGCHEFNMGLSKDNPHHVMFFEVYDNADALAQHEQTEHFKKYTLATQDLVVRRETSQFLSLPMDFGRNTK